MTLNLSQRSPTISQIATSVEHTPSRPFLDRRHDPTISQIATSVEHFLILQGRSEEDPDHFSDRDQR